MATQKVQDQTDVESSKTNQSTLSEGSSSTASKETYSAATSSSLQKPLPKTVKDLGERFKERFKTNLAIANRKQEELNAIPYYVDLKANKFSILNTATDEIDDSDPYNVGVAAFIGSTKKGEIYHFKDDGLKEEAKPVLNDLATYIHKIYHSCVDWRVEQGDTPSSNLFKLVNMYIADLYYYNAYQIKGAIVPKSVLNFYNEKGILPPKKDMVDNQILLKLALKKFNSGKHSDRMADAYVHLITAAFRTSWNSDLENKHKWKENFIDLHKKFTPTVNMLAVKGHLPDVKLSKYRNLFLDTEWEIIKDSALATAEEDMQKLSKKSLTTDNFLEYLGELKRIRRSIDNSLSKEIKQVRKDRLRESGLLKASHKKRTPFKLSDQVAQNWSNTKIVEAFNVFRIPNAAGELNIPSSILITGVEYNSDDSAFSYQHELGADHQFSAIVDGYGRSLVAWLNA
jgi:hypothetical protein